MKSMLQEESSVCRAVEKAWDVSGKPVEFTVKVLSKEIKNFWGILKKPAVISFSYNPRLRTDKEKESSILNKEVRSSSVSNFEKKSFNESALMNKESEIWKKEFVQDINDWVKDILKTIGFNVGFSISVDNKMLNIYLDKRILKDYENEKMFFISLSNLLMQFLKRKYKKKFSNYYLIIHSSNIKNENVA
ncbi:MAG: hypothetical protein ABIF12_00885 [bacterium]